MSGLTAPIADSPPADAYAVPAGPLGLSKAKVAAAVLVAGVVGTAVALSATGGSKAEAGFAVQTMSAPVITFPTFVEPEINEPCGCDDMQIVAQCDDLTVLVDPANSVPLRYAGFNGYYQGSFLRSKLGDEQTWVFSCTDKGAGDRAGFIGAVSICDEEYRTSANLTQFAYQADPSTPGFGAPPYMFYVEKEGYTKADPSVAAGLDFSSAAVHKVSDGSAVSYTPNGWSAGDPDLSKSEWVWDGSARGTAANPRTVVFKFTVEPWTTCAPTRSPTAWPTATPTRWPTSPTDAPTMAPTPPTSAPTTAKPTSAPSKVPTTANPTATPTAAPTTSTPTTGTPTTGTPTTGTPTTGTPTTGTPTTGPPTPFNPNPPGAPTSSPSAPKPPSKWPTQAGRRL